MADNTTLNGMTGGDVIKTEDAGGYKIPVSKIYVGAHGVDGGPVTSANPLPVSGTLAISTLPGGLSGLGDGTAHVVGDKGVMALAVRGDARASLATANGQYAPIVSDQSGSLYTNSALSATHATANGTAVTPQFALINSANLGDNLTVAGQAGKRILVLKFTITAGSVVAATFKSSGGAALTGPLPMVASGGIGGGYCPIGHFQTGVGEGLVLNLSAAVQVSGYLAYLLI